MKYSKPDLYFIAAANADAHCVDGSGASIVHECTDGTGFNPGLCNPGGVPSNNCIPGTVPGTCPSGGVNVEVACLTGTNPV